MQVEQAWPVIVQGMPVQPRMPVPQGIPLGRPQLIPDAISVPGTTEFFRGIPQGIQNATPISSQLPIAQLQPMQPMQWPQPHRKLDEFVGPIIALLVVAAVAFVIIMFATGWCPFGEIICGAMGLLKDVVETVVDLGEDVMRGNLFSKIFDNLIGNSDSQWEMRRKLVHVKSQEILDRLRNIERYCLKKTYIPSKSPYVDRVVYSEGEEKHWWDEYQRMRKDEKLFIFAGENTLMKEHFITGHKTTPEYKVEGTNYIGTGGNWKRVDWGKTAKSAMGVSGWAVGGITGRAGEEPKDEVGNCWVISEGFFSKEGTNGTDDMKSAGAHPKIGGQNNIPNDEIRYLLVPPGMACFVTNYDSFRFDPTKEEEWFACTGPWEGMLPDNLAGKVSSIGVWRLRDVIADTLTKYKRDITPGEMINEFDYEFQRWKWKKWKPELDAKCGKDNGYVLGMEDWAQGNGNWWCIRPGTHISSADGNRENYKDQLSEYTTLVSEDWLDGESKQLSPMHAASGFHHPGDLDKGSDRCKKNGKEMHNFSDCEINNDEVAFVVVPPGMAFMAQGEDENFDRNEGMFEVNGPYVGTIWNTGLTGDEKDLWNSKGSKRTMKHGYFDREDPLATGKLRGTNEKRGKASGFRVRHIGETLCTGCGCFICKKLKGIGGEGYQTKFINPGCGSGHWQHCYAGTGGEWDNNLWRTEADHTCYHNGGGWYRDQREHWNAGGYEPLRVHTEEQCLAQAPDYYVRTGGIDKDKWSYEWMWRKCDNDGVGEPLNDVPPNSLSGTQCIFEETGIKVGEGSKDHGQTNNYSECAEICDGQTDCKYWMRSRDSKSCYTFTDGNLLQSTDAQWMHHGADVQWTSRHDSGQRCSPPPAASII